MDNHSESKKIQRSAHNKALLSDATNKQIIEELVGRSKEFANTRLEVWFSLEIGGGKKVSFAVPKSHLIKALSENS